MAGIRYTAFSGIVPRTAPRLIGQSQAQIAFNVKAKSGQLKPMRGPQAVANTGVLGIKTIYRLDNGENEIFLSWPKDIDVVLAPDTPPVSEGELVALADQTFYYTGDYEPRISSMGLSVPSYPLFIAPFALGIPAPDTAPGASHAGGSSPALNRSFRYTIVVTWFDGTQMESAPSPATASIAGKQTDGTWTINGLRTDLNNDGAAVAVSPDTPAAGTCRITLDDSFAIRVGEEIQFDDSASGLSGLNGSFTVIDVDHASDYVFVSAAVTGTLSGVLVWNRGAVFRETDCIKRVYWSDNGKYRLVMDEIALATASVGIPGSWGSTSFILPDNAEDMPGQPPTTLRGLRQHPSGSYVAFFDNKLCVSEPWKPWSWPTKYQFPVNYPIVGIGIFDRAIVVATTQTPYLMTGSSADSFSEPTQIDERWPCMAKRAVAQQSTFGVSYPTPFGVALIGVGGPAMVTRNLYTVDEWKLLRPETMFSTYYDGALYIGYRPDDNTTRVIVLQPGESTSLFEINLPVQCLYTDEKTGRLFCVIADVIYELDADDSTVLPFDWMGREEVWVKPVFLTTFKVEGDYTGNDAALAAQQAAYDAQVALNQSLLGDAGGTLGEFLIGQYVVNGNQIETPIPPQPPYAQFTLYADGDPIFTTTVEDSKAHRIQAPRDKYDVTAVRVSGTAVIKSIVLSETMEGLKQL